MDEHIIFMKKEVYFLQCPFCNIFETTDKNPSGDILHAHDYTQIWYIVRGTCQHYVEGQLYNLNAGDAFLIQPMMSHKTILAPGSSIISCEVDLEDVLPPPRADTDVPSDLKDQLDLMSIMVFLQNSRNRQPHFIFQPETGRKIRHLMNDLLEEYQQQLPCYMDMLRVKIQELLLLFVREFQTLPAYSSTDAIYERYRHLIEKTIHYIDEHYVEPLTLEDACRISSLSRTYFCYLFKLITHKTFVEYITDKKIQEALRLLEDPTLSITNISEALGFNDSTNFSRTFKKLVGVPPRVYRRLRSPMNSSVPEEKGEEQT